MTEDATYTNRCACGWETTGALDDVVDATIDHGLRIHNMEATREQVLAVVLGGATTPDAAASSRRARSRWRSRRRPSRANGGTRLSAASFRGRPVRESSAVELRPGRHAAASSRPSRPDIEVHADQPDADVRRAEEALGVGGDERFLGTGRRGQPERPSIVVVAVRGRRERPAGAGEPGRLAVAQALGRAVLGKTARPDPGVRIGIQHEAQIARTLLFLASWVSSTSPSASSSGGRYIPNRPR